MRQLVVEQLAVRPAPSHCRTMVHRGTFASLRALIGLGAIRRTQSGAIAIARQMNPSPPRAAETLTELLVISPSATKKSLSQAASQKTVTSAGVILPQASGVIAIAPPRRQKKWELWMNSTPMERQLLEVYFGTGRIHKDASLGCELTPRIKNSLALLLLTLLP